MRTFFDLLLDTPWAPNPTRAGYVMTPAGRFDRPTPHAPRIPGTLRMVPSARRFPGVELLGARRRRGLAAFRHEQVRQGVLRPRVASFGRGLRPTRRPR